MKIIDLSCDVAGRFAARLFALAGVEVYRPVTPVPDDNYARYLDALKTPLALEDIPHLLADADAVFTSFDRGRWLGLAESLHVPASVVQLTTSTFGSTGPYSTYRGGPLAGWAAGGYFAITGEPDREPLIGPEYLCEYVAGYTAAIAVEAAILARERTGHGAHVDISAMESMLGVHQSTFARVAAGLGRQRTGRYTEVYPLVVLPCRDGHISLGVVTDAEFDKLCMAMGRPELVVDSRFSDARARWDHCDELDRELDSFLRLHDGAELAEMLQAHGLAAAKIADVADLLANPQLRHRGFWQYSLGQAMPGNPIPGPRRFANASRKPRTTPPLCIPATTAEVQLPLEGTVVLDFTAFWAGPSATRNLADLGATVIKVERPGSRIDVATDKITGPAQIVEHLYHCKMNRHKLSFAADLGSEDGLAAICWLARNADVIVENFRPGVAEKLGIGPSVLCRDDPGLIYVSLSGFGHDGPWSNWRSYGPTIEASSSIEARTGYRGGEPLRLGHTLPDGVGGLAGTLAALRGLRERAAGGSGGWYDLSQLETYVALSGEEMLSHATLQRIGNRSRSGAIQGAFPAMGEDEWVAIRLADRADVLAFAAITGLDEVADLADQEQRDEDRIEAIISALTRVRSREEIVRLLQNGGLEAFPILRPDELPDDPHLRDRDFLVDIELGVRRVTLPGTPLQAEPALADPQGQAPLFDEHRSILLSARRHGSQ
ncbi:MAG: CoA transferase [Novosphingobium sp.]